MDDLKIDLGCGPYKKKGFFGFDIEKFEGVDEVVNLKEGIPLKKNTVVEVYSSHFFEHVSFKDLDFIIREIYRVCKNGAKVVIRVPHFSSYGAYHEHHKLFFRYQSFREYYDPKYPYSTKKKLFKLTSIKYHIQNPFKFLAPLLEKYNEIYEKTILKYLMPCFELEFTFEVIK